MSEPKEKRINLHVMVAPGTRDDINRLRGKQRSQGELIDEAIAVYETSLRAPASEPPQDGAVDIPALRGEALAALRWWAKEDGVDFATVITRALAVYDTSRTTVHDQVLDDVSAPRSRVADDGRPKNCKCGHCGQRFAGPRGYTLCRACEDGGHCNEPAECPQCTAGMSI